MRHGLKPVSLATPQSYVIVLDSQSCLGIRLALKTLMENTDRQQKVMQGLMETNRSLRDEIQQQSGRASRQEQRANDLENVVKNIKSKICQLEDETIAKVCQQQNQVRELKKDQQASQAKYQQQQEKLQEQEETIARLQKELCKVGLEEQRRVATRNKMFCPIFLLWNLPLKVICRNKKWQQQSPFSPYTVNDNNCRWLVCHLLLLPRGNVAEFHFQNAAVAVAKLAYFFTWLSFIDTFKCKTYNMILFLSNRPSAQELKLYDNFQESSEHLKTIMTVEGRDFIIKCRTYLNNNICYLLLKVLSHIDSILQSPRAPPLIYRRSKGPVQNYIKENGQECGFEHLPLTVEMWADQLMALKDLHRSLKKLSLELAPWHTEDPQDNRESVQVKDLQFIVDAILEEIENKEKTASVPTLLAIVSHFQKLFDVNSLSGIYPRMHEVYTKLGEMTNAMRNLQELLELDSSAPPTVVVNTVGKLCDIINENVTEQVQQLLGTQDIHSIINKLEEHECFFPPFQALIQDLLCLLGE
uniref:Centrosomal protein of 70 kDa n=1 Tax=Amazona collaria TaxID=241587 RepID=A0A8B9GH79_9PSIT